MKKVLNFFLLLSIMTFTFACSESEDATNSDATDSTVTTRTWTDVSYSSASATCKVDIYLPSTGNGPFPTVIWFHGGGFMMGNKSNPQSKQALNDAGFAVVSVDYRLSAEAKWPAQLEDVTNVVKFVKQNAAKYALNPDKIASWGASAGGHLSAMAGAALASNPATRIQASVCWFPPVHFYYMDADMTLSGVSRCTAPNGGATSPESRLLGVTVGENEAICYAASPLSYIDTLATSIPLGKFLIMHGGNDCNIGANQSVRLHTAITSRFGAAKATYQFLPNGTHGGGDFTLASTEATVISFLNEVLK